MTSVPLPSRIYLDYNATTPVDPAVLDAMLPFLREAFGNAASAHAFGCEANQAVEKARAQVASLIGADPREIIFTSGATESDNLAIKGVAQQYREKGRHIITAVHEHHAVIDPLHKLESPGTPATPGTPGFDVTWLRPAPASGGIITADQVATALRDDTILVTIMWANNEIGTINEVHAIGKLCHERGVIFHTDATQAVGKVPVNVNAANIDLLSASAHKFYGPKGVGFLYVRRKGPRVRLDAQLDGGGQERGHRSGTLNVPGIVGLGKACELAASHMNQEATRLAALRAVFEAALLAQVPGSQVNGNRDQRLPHTTNISFPGIESEALLAAMPDIAASAGAACTSAQKQASHVLRAIGVPDELAHGAVRFSLGRFTTEAEITRAVERIVETLRKQPGDAASCDVAAE
ncbi:MAG: cysteine desulfurase family protein [Phycisphaeraceae bacterium]